MKKIAVIVLGLTLSACVSEKPVSENLADNAVNATTALEQGLSKECKTDSIITQITVVKTEIKAISKACQTEKQVITQEKRKYQILFFGLLALVGIFLVKKVLK